jgi:hypothetical protein
MFGRTVLAAVAGAGLLALAPQPAAAGPFKFLRSLMPDYGRYEPLPDGAYVMDEEDYYQYLKHKRQRRRVIEESYYDPNYDEQRDPVYTQPKKAKKKQVKPPVKTVAVPPAAKKAAPPKAVASIKPQPKTIAVAKPKTAVPEVTTTASTSAASSGMSCGKATQIISGYGFDSVSPQSCAGKIYAFSAKRSGKAYLVRLDAASGELTEVKKVQ